MLTQKQLENGLLLLCHMLRSNASKQEADWIHSGALQPADLSSTGRR